MEGKKEAPEGLKEISEKLDDLIVLSQTQNHLLQGVVHLIVESSKPHSNRALVLRSLGNELLRQNRKMSSNSPHHTDK